MNAAQKSRQAEIFDMFDEWVKGTAVDYNGDLRALLDEYAELRVKDAEAELVTQIHRAMQKRAESKTPGSLLEHAHAIAAEIVGSNFPRRT